MTARPPAILLLEALHPEALALLASQTRVVQCDGAAQALAAAAAHDVLAILTRGAGVISRELMQLCPNLRAISRVGAGVDTIDVRAAAAQRVQVIYGPGINAAATADHTLMLLLMITRRAAELVTQVKAGNWAIRDEYTGVELRGRTLGIFGFGAIGREVAARAWAFGMRILCTNRSPIRPDDGAQQVTLPELLAASDVVSLHMPLNTDTRGIFGEREFAQMKSGAFLINTARGALVDKQALRSALDTAHLAGYAADVFLPQPPEADDLELINRNNVILTPHIGGLTDTSYRQVCLYCARNVLAVLQGRNPDDASVFRASA